jgi:drug/metabolite transporter (DMT)-like permease
MPVLCLILACALWGLSFPLIKALHLEQSARVPGATSEFLAAWMQVGRFALGALILWPFARRVWRPTRLEWRQAGWLALWGGLGMALQADGLAHTEASTSAFLTQAYCVILPLVACVRARRGPSVVVTIATLMVMAGGAILSGWRPGDLHLGRGETETLLAALLFSFQILTLEDPRYAGNRGLVITFLMCAAIALGSLPLALATAPSPAALVATVASWPVLGLLAALALGCTVGAYLLMNVWQPRVSAVEAGLIYTTEPVFTSLYVLFLPVWLGTWIGQAYANESLTPALLGGGTLIVAANVLVQQGKRFGRTGGI